MKKILLWTALLGCFLLALGRLENRTNGEGVRQLDTALRRAAVSCYAQEGFYPPNVDYLVENYGIRYDTDRYIVHYQWLASNWMPDITVLEAAP